jgi:cellulose biosynthesis protein BcsQ/CheY-like chemotaxis protein
MSKFEGTQVHIVMADHDSSWMMESAQELNLHPQLKVIGFAQNGRTLLERIRGMEIDAVLTEASLPDMTAGEIAREVSLPVFAVTYSMSKNLIQELKSMGVKEVFSKSEFDAEEVAAQIASHIDTERKEKSEYQIPQEEPEKKTTEKPRKKRTELIGQTVILTYNTKGGVGKTTVAANLALAIKMSPYLVNERVCLVDFDAGGANIITNIHMTDSDAANRNIAMWEYMPEDISLQEMNSFLIEGPRGLMVAAAPVNQAVSERISIDLADKILRVLKKHYKIIVIDGAPNISPLIDSALIHSTHILMIANPEGQSVRQLSRIVKLLAPDPNNPKKPNMNHILRKTFLVLNHVRPSTKWDLQSNEIAEIIGKPIFMEIPFNDSVLKALHGTENKLAVELESAAAFSNAVKLLANSICNAYPGATSPTKKTPRKGMLSKLMK